MEASSIIGVDLGTTNCTVAVWKDGIVRMIPNDLGEHSWSALVAFTENGSIVGQRASTHRKCNSENTVVNTKRLIGKTFSQIPVSEDPWCKSARIVAAHDDSPLLEIQTMNERKRFHPEQIYQIILKKLKGSAESFLGHKVKGAVITVPSYFTYAQRQATSRSAMMAGFELTRLLNDPTAVGFAYSLYSRSSEERNILVYDLGSGTLSVSIITIDDGLVEVRATSGNTSLGGEEFDRKILEFCAEDFSRKNPGHTVYGNQRALERLRIECEKAKRTLSSCMNAEVEVDALVDGLNYSCSISRSTFEGLCSDLFESTLEPIKEVLKTSGYMRSQIHDIVMVGGSSRIPKIQQLVSALFEGKAVFRGLNADEAVVTGAAIQGAIINGDGIERLGYSLSLDVIPRSLGVECSGGELIKLIERNTTIPTKMSREFTTAGSKYVQIKVFEGDSPLTTDNTLIGCFVFASSRRELQIMFDIDCDGTLTIVADDSVTPDGERERSQSRGCLCFRR
jgi:heat shock protein 1/8